MKKEPFVPIIYQRVAEIWFYAGPFPISYLMYHYLERKWLTRYKEIPTVTISKSSKEDLESIGFKKVFIIPIGLNFEPLSEITDKESKPTVVFLRETEKIQIAKLSSTTFFYN